MLSTVDLLVLTSLIQFIFILKIVFTCFTKQATLMRRSTGLSLPLQLVFPGCGLLSKLQEALERSSHLTLSKEISKSNKLMQKPSALPTLPLPLPYICSCPTSAAALHLPLPYICYCPTWRSYPSGMKKKGFTFWLLLLTMAWTQRYKTFYGRKLRIFVVS
jgi:hypothetical protein